MVVSDLYSLIFILPLLFGCFNSLWSCSPRDLDQPQSNHSGTFVTSPVALVAKPVFNCTKLILAFLKKKSEDARIESPDAED